MVKNHGKSSEFLQRVLTYLYYIVLERSANLPRRSGSGSVLSATVLHNLHTLLEAKCQHP